MGLWQLLLRLLKEASHDTHSRPLAHPQRLVVAERVVLGGPEQRGQARSDSIAEALHGLGQAGVLLLDLTRLPVLQRAVQHVQQCHLPLAVGLRGCCCGIREGRARLLQSTKGSSLP